MPDDTGMRGIKNGRLQRRLVEIEALNSVLLLCKDIDALQSGRLIASSGADWIAPSSVL